MASKTQQSIEIEQQAEASSSQLQPQNPPLAVFRRLPNKRFVYEFNGKPVYEWIQTIDECIMYIPAPPAPVSVMIQPNHLTVGLKNGAAPFIDEDTCHHLNVGESTWTLEEGQIVIYMQKANKALVWEALLQGRPFQRGSHPIILAGNTAARLDPFQMQQVQQEIMLERWGEQYPGMDFEDAKFNGSVPDPRTFMGGVAYE